VTKKPTPDRPDPAPPEILIMFWCDTCDRIDFHNPKNHFDNGKRCPGLMYETQYVHAP
jgi:hypothetical protein